MHGGSGLGLSARRRELKRNRRERASGLVADVAAPARPNRSRRRWVAVGVLAVIAAGPLMWPKLAAVATSNLRAADSDMLAKGTSGTAVELPQQPDPPAAQATTVPSIAERPPVQQSRPMLPAPAPVPTTAPSTRPPLTRPAPVSQVPMPVSSTVSTPVRTAPGIPGVPQVIGQDGANAPTTGSAQTTPVPTPSSLRPDGASPLPQRSGSPSPTSGLTPGRTTVPTRAAPPSSSPAPIVLLPATPLPDDSSTAFQDSAAPNSAPQARSSAALPASAAQSPAAQTPTAQPRAVAPGRVNPVRPVAEFDTPAQVVSDTSCAGVTRPARDGPSLSQALSGARAGDVIQLADGTYKGNFTATAQGTADRPITLCGTRNAVLGATGGYGLHLDGASHWRLAGFTIRGGAKGLMLDRARSNLVEGLLIEQAGEEGLHLRMGSSDNLVRGNEVRLTGRTSAEYGEGVYIGSAQKNWSKFGDGGGGPDRSDRNVIELNTITDTVAENVDIKEGTTGGILRGNTFSGRALAGGFADSWVDVKGNGWTIADNVGTDSPADGFQVHEIVSGWGVDNRFDNNSATLGRTGYAINVTKNPQRNVVSCTNRVTGGRGLSNIACTGSGV